MLTAFVSLSLCYCCFNDTSFDSEITYHIHYAMAFNVFHCRHLCPDTKVAVCQSVVLQHHVWL